MSNALFIVTARLTAVFVRKCKDKAFNPQNNIILCSFVTIYTGDILYSEPFEVNCFCNFFF